MGPCGEGPGPVHALGLAEESGDAPARLSLSNKDRTSREKKLYLEAI